MSRRAGWPATRWRARVSGTAALGALSAAAAAPASLAGATVCLSPTTTVMVGGVPGPERVAGRLYAELKASLRSQGVRFTEAAACRGAAADLTVVLDVTPRLDGGRETRVSGRVDDRSRAGSRWVPGSDLRWSVVVYGRADAAEVEARLLNDAQTLLARFVRDWRAANP